MNIRMHGANWIKKGALLCSAAFFALSAPAHAANLSDMLRELIATHPEVKSAIDNVDAARARVDEAEGRYYPTVNLSAEAGPQTLDTPSRRALGQDNSNLLSKKATLTVTQNLFNGYRTSSQYDASKAASDSNIAFKQAIEQRLIVEGALAFLNVIRGEELIELARSNEATIREQLELEDERVKRGSGISVDVLQAKSRLQLSIERRVGFQGRLRRFNSDYQRLFGLPPEGLSDENLDIPLNDIPSSLDVALDIAKKENPQIMQFRHRVTELTHQKTVEEASYYPSLDLVGSYSVEDDFDGTRGVNRDAKIILQASWDLFNGFQTQARAEAAIKTLAASRNDVGTNIRNTERLVRDAWADWETAKERTELLENAVNIAQEVFDSRRKLRESGKETALNVLDAEGEVFNARINLVEAEFDRRIAEYRLLHAMGRIGLTHLGIL